MQRYSVTIERWDDNGVRKVRNLVLRTNDISRAIVSLRSVYDVISLKAAPMASEAPLA